MAPLRSMERINKVSSLQLGITGGGQFTPAVPRFFKFLPGRAFYVTAISLFPFPFSLFPFRVAVGHV